MCFLPLPSLLLREQVRIGVVVEPGSFLQPRKNLRQESRRSADLIVEDALVEVMESPLAEVGGILA